MDMKLDNAKLKTLRESKAWSQSHLAQISGISLRTIQRIEKTGIASPESFKSLCATFDIQVAELSVNEPQLQENESTASNVFRSKITSVDKKAAAVSFIIAFIIAFVLTSWSA